MSFCVLGVGLGSYRKGGLDLSHQTPHASEPTTRPDPDALLNQGQAASLIGVSERTLECWRWRGDGPPYVKISRRAVRYRRKDIQEWAESRLQRSTSDPQYSGQGG